MFSTGRKKLFQELTRLRGFFPGAKHLLFKPVRDLPNHTPPPSLFRTKKMDLIGSCTMFDVERVRQKYELNEEEVSYLKTLDIDDSEREQIAHAEQGTDPWLKARSGRITASRCGATIFPKMSDYSDKGRLLRDMLWNTFKGNMATEYGKNNESNGVNRYIEIQRKTRNLNEADFSVSHRGLIISKQHPWLGVSIDGLVFDPTDPKHVRYGLEIKCPFKQTLYPFIPGEYYCQIQVSMGILRTLPCWDFVVWTPEQTQVRRFYFDAELYDTVLFPSIEAFYMTEFLPRKILQNKGLLRQGEIDVCATPPKPLHFVINLPPEDSEPGTTQPTKRHRLASASAPAPVPMMSWNVKRIKTT